MITTSVCRSAAPLQDVHNYTRLITYPWPSEVFWCVSTLQLTHGSYWSHPCMEEQLWPSSAVFFAALGVICPVSTGFPSLLLLPFSMLSSGGGMQGQDEDDGPRTGWGKTVSVSDFMHGTIGDGELLYAAARCARPMRSVPGPRNFHRTEMAGPAPRAFIGGAVRFWTLRMWAGLAWTLPTGEGPGRH
ncbi:hypothetical protein Taro_047076 [Colocasia esculenta]|uniref:Uncharacterized protein n=1 Tax=Colocasia esculenta TaxID=4460 RepID=A0A843X4Z6_COLES|nr:hypothetical protein [Colocasia esculenta]